MADSLTRPLAAQTAVVGPATVRSRPAGPRRARLTLVRIDPWSVLKTSATVGVCLLIVVVVATAVLYAVLDAAGVFTAVERTVHSALNVHLPLSPLGIIGGAAVIALLNVVFLVALLTIGAFIYNVAADLVGGVEGVLSERESPHPQPGPPPR